jgi:hypothetical protein
LLLLPQEVGGGVTVFRASADPSRAAADGIAAAMDDDEEECDGIAMLVAEEEEATGRDDAAPAGPAAAMAVVAPVDAEEGEEEEKADEEAASLKPAASRECAWPTSAAAAGLKCGRCTDGWVRRWPVAAAVLPPTAVARSVRARDEPDRVCGSTGRCVWHVESCRSHGRSSRHGG